MNRKICVAALAAGVSLSAGYAYAGPALSGLVGEADNAESVFAAPAAMSRLEGNHMTVQGMYVASFSDFDVDENKTTIDGGDPENGDDPIIIPSLYYVRQLNDDWHVGASLTVPTGFGSDYGPTWAGRYQTVDYSLVYIALTPAVSYRVNDKFSLGASLGINYTSSVGEVKIPQPLGERDGKITSDLDGVGVNGTISLFYEFSEKTRGGISWTSDSEADLEGTVKLRNLGPILDEIAERRGIRNVDTEVTNTLPQRVLAGIYHEFDSGTFVTFDTMWMKFSDFTVDDIKLNGEDLEVTTPEIYDDFWAFTAGVGFPVSDRLTYKFGAMYMTQPVDDEDRTFAIRLDSMWALGAGITYRLENEKELDVNATFLNVGESPVDIDGTAGRVAGKSEDPYAMMFELTYHF